MNNISEIFESLAAEIRQSHSDESTQVEILERVFESSLPEITSVLINELKKKSHFMLSEHKYIDEEYTARRNRRWFEAFDLLEEFSVISYEIGEDIGNRGAEFNTNETKYLYEILLRLHARSIQITKEILTLMKHGFADGAMARWRTLYEISIIALFISENGNEIAKMYIDYNQVESYEEMIVYLKNAERLGLEQITNEEQLKIKNRIEELKTEYGIDFVKSYGWTKNVLPNAKRNFKGIEESIDEEHLRPYYKWACNAVHAGPKAAYYKFGNFQYHELLFAGPTNYGFADPGQNTALAILQITSILILNFTTYDNLVAISALSELFNELKSKFCEIQKQIEQEEKEE